MLLRFLHLFLQLFSTKEDGSISRKSAKYFTDEELWSNDNRVVKLDPRFDEALLKFREKVGFPLYVNSCCRSVAHNKHIGGAKNSYHLYEGVNDGRKGTLAIDLHVTDGAKRAIMIETALKLGFSVGTYKNFIHIDLRTALGKDKISFPGGY